MTDESCGCDCYDCSSHDIHQCGRQSCGYAKYQSSPAAKRTPPPESVENALEIVRTNLGMQFKQIRDPDSRARLAAWGKAVVETEELEEVERRAARVAKQIEIFGETL